MRPMVGDNELRAPLEGSSSTPNAIVDRMLDLQRELFPEPATVIVAPYLSVKARHFANTFIIEASHKEADRGALACKVVMPGLDAVIQASKARLANPDTMYHLRVTGGFVEPVGAPWLVRTLTDKATSPEVLLEEKCREITVQMQVLGDIYTDVFSEAMVKLLLKDNGDFDRTVALARAVAARAALNHIVDRPNLGDLVVYTDKTPKYFRAFATTAGNIYSGSVQGFRSGIRPIRDGDKRSINVSYYLNPLEEYASPVQISSPVKTTDYGHFIFHMLDRCLIEGPQMAEDDYLSYMVQDDVLTFLSRAGDSTFRQLAEAVRSSESDALVARIYTLTGFNLDVRIVDQLRAIALSYDATQTEIAGTLLRLHFITHLKVSNDVRFLDMGSSNPYPGVLSQGYRYYTW